MSAIDCARCGATFNRRVGATTPYCSDKCRLLVKVQRGPNCWLWTGRTSPDGYGVLAIQGVTTGAHRAAYAFLVGPIPDGMQVDHLCFNPPCVNPEHLRLLTPRENARLQRKAFRPHCKHGHEFTPENTYIRVLSRTQERARICRTCSREASRRFEQRKREATQQTKDETP